MRLHSRQKTRSLTVLPTPALWGFWDTLSLCLMISGLLLIGLGILLGSMFPAIALMASMAMVLIGVIGFCLGRLGLAFAPKKPYRPSYARSAATGGYPALAMQNKPVTFRQFSDHLHQP